MSDRNEPAGGAGFTWPDFSELGTMLLGKYEVHDRFKGGFGIVLHVVETKTGQEFAVKIPQATAPQPLSSALQFRSEVEFWLNLPVHPNIVEARFVSEIADRPALFMEYVGGKTYGSVAKWLELESIPEATAFDFAHQLCLAMEFANRQGEIAHRDLKPQNLLIAGASWLKVTDFGSAVRVEVQGKTYPKVTSGSWPYAAPEMLRRETADTRSDIYAFGMILCEMLMRRLPFPFKLDTDSNASYAQLAQFYSSQQFRSSGGLGQALTGCSNRRMADLVRLCLAPEPSERPHDFARLLRLLNDALGIDGEKMADADATPERLFAVAVGLRQLGKYSEALSKLNLLLIKHPDHPRRAEFLREAADNLRLSGSPGAAAHFENMS